MRELSIFNYLPKPLDPMATRHMIEHAIRQNKLIESLLEARQELDDARARINGLTGV